MKTFYKFLSVAAAISFAACTQITVNPDDEQQKDPEGEKPQEEVLNQDLAFTLEVTEVEADKVKISVSNNGTTDDKWYGFVTSEVDESDLDLITAEVEAMLAEGSITGLKRQVSTTITIRGLEPETDYKYIVVGLSEEGEVYGTPASVEFTTIKAETQYTINPAWNVEYTGPAEINGNLYDHTVTVISSDTNPYFITAVSKETFETVDMKTIATEEIAYLQAFLDEYNATYGSNITLSQMLYTESGIDALALSTGDWYALAIGVGADGEPSGLYAVSDLISIAEEEASEAYSAWLGNWTFTGSNGVAFDITFHKGVANQSFLMTGWENIPDLPVEVTWMEDLGMWVIFTKLLAQANFGSMGDGDVWFVGNDGVYLYPVEEVPVCIGGSLEDGTRICIGYSEEDEETGEILVEFAYAHYIADIAGSYYTISDTEVWPEFPITITPAEETAASTKAASVEAKSVQMFTNTPRVFKAFPTSFMAR